MINWCEKQKKVYSQGKIQEKSGFLRQGVDEKEGFHMVFRSYSQVIPTMWITCELNVEELGMECGLEKKGKVAHYNFFMGF